MKGVIFDFWGTLVENGTYSPMKQTFSMLRVRIPFSQFVEKFERIFMTKSFPSKADAFKEVCREFDIPVKEFIIDNLVGLWNKNVFLASLYDDTVESLKQLREKGVKIALVSNCPDNNVEPVLEKFALSEFFDVILLSHKEGLLKTDKEFYDRVLENLDLEKDEVIVVGDSYMSDIKGAEKAGIKAIMIDRKDKRDYENKIKSLLELTEVQ